MEIIRVKNAGGREIAYDKDSGLKLIEKDGFTFKDFEGTGELLPYEDWRLPYEERAKDLAGRLSLDEIAGLMLYSPHQMVPAKPTPPFPGTYDGAAFDEATMKASALSDQQKHFLKDENIRHILLTTVKDARTSAEWNNELQAMAERLPHGIPVNISSDPRSGARAADQEFRTSGQDVSKWPEGIGFAACFDDETVKQFAHDASIEYRAMGIGTALGPQIDLCTEPRWMRFADTFGEDVKRSLKITKDYCDYMQTTDGADGGWGKHSVNTMVKHWPGGGTGEGGRDAHYRFGKFGVYPGGNSAEHEKPFTEAAFKLDGPTKAASAVMPYYSVSYGLDPSGKNVGNSYSDYMIRELLRGKYEYKGIVCTDWGITGDPAQMNDFGPRSFGVEDLTVAGRHLLCIMNGVDQFGGNSEKAPIIEAYRIGCARYGEEIMRERYALSAERLLLNIFHLGLFEDPYLDPEESAKIVGCETFTEHGYKAQQKSVVLLKNKAVLPLKKGLKIYVPIRHVGEVPGFLRFPDKAHDIDPVTEEVISKYGTRVATPEEADIAIVFAESPVSNPYHKDDADNGGNGYFPISLQYRPYTATAAREHSIAGGDFRETFADRSYLGKTNTTANEADLDNILETKKAMGDKPVIVALSLRNPTCVYEFESSADAITVDFGVSRSAVLDTLFGIYEPTGRLPIQMPKDMETVEKQCEDVALDMIPYTDECGNTYDYAFGMNYSGVL